MTEQPKRGPGRPQKNPEGARPRAIRLTDAEWIAVVAFVQRLRAAPPRPKAGGK